ncbi:gastrin [Lepus europaeus]|uniref:gastrin n=1 Tax=Lepus europaeus TaxID=9983 RepID=UPI002B486691|nr:gastrin [Lepus europaeus]
MVRPWVSVLVLAMALAAFCQASRRPHSQPQDAASGPVASRGLEPRWLDEPGPASHHRRQLGAQAAPHLVPDLSKKQGPWLQEEEEAYGWMDFGRRSAEEPELRP